jgi:hypothetical protein
MRQNCVSVWVIRNDRRPTITYDSFQQAGKDVDIPVDEASCLRADTFQVFSAVGKDQIVEVRLVAAVCGITSIRVVTCGTNRLRSHGGLDIQPESLHGSLSFCIDFVFTGNKPVTLYEKGGELVSA